MKKVLIIGNLKATPASIKTLQSYFALLSKKKYEHLPCASLAVPFPFIHECAALTTKNISIGAQNITCFEEGAHTGAVTVSMIKSIGAEFCIVGHSEVRRAGDSEEIVQKKAGAVIAKKMTAVICVGEEERDRDGRYLEYIEKQVKSALTLVHKDDVRRVVIAYEPLWAIGGDRSATEEECFEVIISIRRTLTSLVGIEIAKKVLVLYGGAVSEDNAHSFITKGGADGLLVGRASWKPETFISLIEKAHAIS
jgi:triosephosphate isomerase (TIM)